MLSALKEFRLSDVRLPEIERPKVDLSEIELPKVELPKVDLSEIEVPKVDVGKALADAAAAVGLSKPRRARWPFVLGAGLLVAAAGWAVMNSATIRERLARARTWATQQVDTMRAGSVSGEPVAFTAAPTAPLDQPSATDVGGTPGADYPEGLGASSDAVTDQLGTNGRSTVVGSRSS